MCNTQHKNTKHEIIHQSLKKLLGEGSFGNVFVVIQGKEKEADL